MKNILSLRWLATRALALALVMWVIIIGIIRLAPPSEAENGYLNCRHEDSRACLYDTDHRFGRLDYAPINFWISDGGKVWRLPHHVTHHLLYGSARTYLPCRTDGQDHGPCVWRADVRGNGEGRSYFLGRTGGVWYMPHHIAYHLVTS